VRRKLHRPVTGLGGRRCHRSRGGSNRGRSFRHSRRWRRSGTGTGRRRRGGRVLSPGWVGLGGPARCSATGTGSPAGMGLALRSLRARRVHPTPAPPARVSVPRRRASSLRRLSRSRRDGDRRGANARQPNIGRQRRRLRRLQQSGQHLQCKQHSNDGPQDLRRLRPSNPHPRHASLSDNGPELSPQLTHPIAELPCAARKRGRGSPRRCLPTAPRSDSCPEGALDSPHRRGA
jgi:hypothetical protein